MRDFNSFAKYSENYTQAKKRDTESDSDDKLLETMISLASTNKATTQNSPSNNKAS